MEVDYTGAQTVASVIKNTKLSKFIIYKAGTSRNSVPVLDFSHGTSPDNAIEAFEDWAKLANNGNPYEMILFKKDGDQDPDAIPGKKKDKLIKFSFCLNGSGSSNNPYSGYGNNVPIGLIMENANLKADQKVNQMMFQMQMDEMKRRMDELEEEDDDSGELAGLGKLNDWMPILVEHLTGKKVPSSTSTINGPLESSQQQTQTPKHVLTVPQVENIKKAIAVLAEHNPQIDQDLLKLAAIAQQKPDTYKFLINSLRSM